MTDGKAQQLAVQQLRISNLQMLLNNLCGLLPQALPDLLLLFGGQKVPAVHFGNAAFAATADRITKGGGAETDTGGLQQNLRIFRCSVYNSGISKFVKLESTMDKQLLALLVCPVSHAPLQYNKEAQELVCKASGLAYPIRDGLPVMLESEARQLTAEEKLEKK